MSLVCKITPANEIKSTHIGKIWLIACKWEFSSYTHGPEQIKLKKQYLKHMLC